MTPITDSKRLFDCLDYHLQYSPLEDMLAAKQNGEWVKYSTQKVAGDVNSLSAGLLALGITCGDMTSEKRDKVAVVSKNRPEWLILDMAVQRIGAVLVPVYPTINASELQYILNEAQVKIIFIDDEKIFDKLSEILNELPHLKEIYSFELIDNSKHWKEIFSLSTPELLSDAFITSKKIKYDDLATIIYTSGTTGVPKGVMLSHKNLLSNVIACLPCFPPGKNMKALSFLPLNHIFERMTSYIYLFKGTSIYYAENLNMIGENLKEVKPHMFTTVPYLLEKVYDKIMIKGNQLTGIKRKLFFWAHNLATKFEINKNMGFVYNIQLYIANKLIFKKWREALGGRLKCIISGGAACQVRLIKIFTAANIPIMEGYGLTETSPVISVNRFNEDERMIGTVGPLISGVSVKIDGDGEILCKGSNVMMGYYKQPALTAEAFKDGWFKTGDIGTIIDEKFLKITDRKKEMFKTSGGKYVAPLPIENKLKESTYIENVLIIGADQKYTGALIVPAFDNLKEWCESKQISCTSNEQMINNTNVIEMYDDIIRTFNSGFSHVEQIKKFELLPNNWSIEAGEMTPKLSLRRKIILEKYKDFIAKIYSQS